MNRPPAQPGPTQLALLPSALVAHPDAPAYARCATEEFQECPLYQALCAWVACSPALLALHDLAPPTQRRATLLLAALHERVLHQGQPLGLGAWYDSVGGTRRPDDPALGQALAQFVAEEGAALASLLRSRHTQTNEVGRCAVLWPALAHLAATTGNPRLALFDLGCSAGLNLQVDACRISYPSIDGGAPLSVGPADAPLHLHARHHGPPPPHGPTWHLAHRLGVDPQPVDLNDPASLRWLRACLWPGDPARDARLQSAAALARQRPWPVERCSDGLARLGRWLDGLPARVQPVLFHSWVMAYLNPDERARWRQVASDLVRDRGLAWLSAEDGDCTDALGGVVRPDRPLPDEARASPQAQTYWRLQTRGGTQLLARSHPHGAWLEWLAPAGAAPARVAANAPRGE